MDYKNHVTTILVFVCTIGAAYFLFAQNFWISAFFIIPSFYFLVQIIRQQNFLQKQFEEFAEAVKYKDFTRKYPVKSKSKIKKDIFSSFNQINQAFKEISAEKEMQHYYLSEIISMLDAAILFYQADTGKVVLINNAFKDLFLTPHIGNVAALEKRNPDLYEKIQKLYLGSQQLETVLSSKGKTKLLIQMSEFEKEQTPYRIVVFQNISKAIDETENLAWHKLLRVLTHEIMNSIAPISSLSETLNERLQKLEETDTLKDIKTGISTIKNRSEGLLQFAKSYRLINKVDQPHFEEISIAMLFENVYQLFEPKLIESGIELDIILKNVRLSISADRHLVEQTLINLILNAIQALNSSENPKIRLIGLEKEKEIWIQVADNGYGMEHELIEQVFTPFFTTKKAGSGIGLTLSKQIMLVHQGNISIESEPSKGTVVSLRFNN